MDAAAVYDADDAGALARMRASRDASISQDCRVDFQTASHFDSGHHRIGSGCRCNLVSELGLALALGPIVAVHFAGEAERRGIPIDFPFLLAVNGGAGSVWQFGLSASGPLLMATSGHFLETITGTMSLLSTIWSPAALALVITFPVAVIFVARLLMPGHPQQLSQFPSACKLAEPLQTEDQGDASFSQKIEHHWLIAAILCLGMLAWLYYHFIVKRSSLDLNSLNTIFLMLCFLLHRNIRNFRAHCNARCCPVGRYWFSIICMRGSPT
jgi:short subunit fatty acids transporter